VWQIANLSGVGTGTRLEVTAAGETLFSQFAMPPAVPQISRLTASGSPEGGIIPADGRLFSPADVALDAAGNILVENRALNEIVKLAPTGDVLGSWSPNDGMPAQPNPLLSRPMAAATSEPPPPPPGGSGNRQLSKVTDAPGDVVYTYMGGFTSGVGNALFRVDPVTPVVVDFQTVNGNPMLSGQDYLLRARAYVPFSAVTQYEFDTNGDGTFDGPAETDSLGAFRRAHYDQPGHYELQVRVTGARGGTVTSRPTVGMGYLDVRLAPPTGQVGVSIDDGATYTNNPRVTLELVWPVLASEVLIANDGGFRNTLPTPLAATVRWRLASSGPERLPKTVYVRYQGLPNDMPPGGVATGQAINFTDDIILDETPPKLMSATIVGGSGKASAARAPRKRTFKLRLRASDNVSGVRSVQFAVKKRKPGRPLRYRRVLKIKATRRPRLARVVDRAGNVSRWRVVR
jgi:hypothetical protein